MSWRLSVALGLCLLSVPAAAQEAVDIKAPDEIKAHELSARHFLPIAKPDQDKSPWRWVTMQIVVGIDGSVVSATPLQGTESYFEQSVQAALRSCCQTASL